MGISHFFDSQFFKSNLSAFFKSSVNLPELLKFDSGAFGRIIAILTTYTPSGIAYGTLATALHIPWYYTISLSLVVYSGAVQSTFVGLWAIGLDPITMVFTALLLNLRHTFYGPHLEEKFPQMSSGDMYSIAPFLTDEIYALAVSNPPMKIPEVRKLSYFAYSCWVLSSALGVALTGGLPAFLYPILYLALPALFLALMVPRVKGGSTALSAAVSIAVTIVIKVNGLPEYSILVSIGAGILAGLVMLKLGGSE